MLGLLVLDVALGDPSVAEFTEPASVRGFTEPTGPVGCAIRFEYQDPERGWTRFRYGLSLPSGDAWAGSDPIAFVPPHDEPVGDGVGGHARGSGHGVVWRIVDGDGGVVTAFDGPHARDALPLATVLSAVDAYQRGNADPRCVARPGLDCWTAFELWVFWEDWAAQHCDAAR